MTRGLQRALAPLRQRLALMVGRAVVVLVNDGLKLQGLQISLLADEVREDVERFQEYGFTSHPLPGAEAVAAAVSGSRDHLVVLAVDDRRYRIKGLAAGEVAIYTDEGDQVVLRRGGTIEVKAATKLQVTAPAVTMSGTLSVQGNITCAASITATGNVADQGGAKTMAGMRTAYDGHKHGTSATPTPGM